MEQTGSKLRLSVRLAGLGAGGDSNRRSKSGRTAAAALRPAATASSSRWKSRNPISPSSG